MKTKIGWRIIGLLGMIGTLILFFLVNCLPLLDYASSASSDPVAYHYSDLFASSFGAGLYLLPIFGALGIALICFSYRRLSRGAGGAISIAIGALYLYQALQINATVNEGNSVGSYSQAYLLQTGFYALMAIVVIYLLFGALGLLLSVFQKND